jgi:hypothetical protein
MTLLFRLAEWHALAKLRLHTESTLALMESVTAALGCELRRFRSTTCSAFHTMELPKETAARGRKASKKTAKAASDSTALPTQAPQTSAAPETISSETTPEIVPKKKKRRTLNLSTYKVHALGDYVRTIRMFGTTDSYSTQTVRYIILYHLCSLAILSFIKGELEHRRVKRLYGRTNKNGAIKQMTKHERRETRLLRAHRATSHQQLTIHTHHVAFSEQDPLPYTDAALHHHISETKKYGQDAFSFGKLFPDDPATKVRLLYPMKCSEVIYYLIRTSYHG